MEFFADVGISCAEACAEAMIARSSTIVAFNFLFSYSKRATLDVYSLISLEEEAFKQSSYSVSSLILLSNALFYLLGRSCPSLASGSTWPRASLKVF